MLLWKEVNSYINIQNGGGFVVYPNCKTEKKHCFLKSRKLSWPSSNSPASDEWALHKVEIKRQELQEERKERGWVRGEGGKGQMGIRRENPPELVIRLALLLYFWWGISSFWTFACQRWGDWNGHRDSHSKTLHYRRHAMSQDKFKLWLHCHWGDRMVRKSHVIYQLHKVPSNTSLYLIKSVLPIRRRNS